MRRDSIAEWILATVTSPERAATIVGDLLEEPATRGGTTFWLHVLRSGGSLLWSGFTSEPRFMLSLAFRAWPLMLGLQVLTVVLAFALFSGGLLATAFAAVTGRHFVFWGNIWKLLNAAITIWVAYPIGRWVASRAPGREISACLAMLVVGAAVGCVAAFALATARGNLALGLDLTSLCAQAALFIGALRVRRERVVRAYPSGRSRRPQRRAEAPRQPGRADPTSPPRAKI